MYGGGGANGGGVMGEGRTSPVSFMCSAGGCRIQSSASATDILRVLTRAERGWAAGAGGSSSSTDCSARCLQSVAGSSFGEVAMGPYDRV